MKIRATFYIIIHLYFDGPRSLFAALKDEDDIVVGVPSKETGMLVGGVVWRLRMSSKTAFQMLISAACFTMRLDSAR